MGKEENAGYLHFLLFPQCFQKRSFLALASELFSWHCVRPSVHVCVRASINSSFKKLLRNYPLDFYENSQKCSLDGPLSNSFK